MKRIPFLVVLLFLAFNSFSFQNLDSLESALETSSGENKVDILNKLYIVYNRTDPTKALEKSILALELANDIGYAKGRANSLNNIGVIYKNQGVFEEALEYYIESLRISTEIGDEEAKAATLNNIGTVYSLKGTHDKALIYFIESYDIFKSIGAKGKLIDATNNIGNAYMEMGREDLALDFYSEAMTMSEVDGNKPEVSNPLNNVGNVYFYRQDYANALTYYQRGLSLEEERQDVLGKAHAFTSIGSTFLELKEYKKAAKNLNQALELASSMGAYPLLRVIYKNLARLYYEQNDLKKAYDYRVSYDKAKDFVFNEESSRMMAQMEVAVELQEKEKELQELKKDQQIQTLQLENSRIIVILAIMGCIVLMAVGFIILKVRRQKSRN